MFNLLGSIFGYGGQQPEPSSATVEDQQQQENTLQQNDCAVTANQATQTQVDSAAAAVSNAALMAKSTVTPGGAEWVIVDRTEGNTTIQSFE
jgi:hypothetical protein